MLLEYEFFGCRALLVYEFFGYRALRRALQDYSPWTPRAQGFHLITHYPPPLATTARHPLIRVGH